MTDHKSSSSFSPHPNRRRNGLLGRVVMYIIMGLIIPFILKRIRNQLIKEQLLRCERCKRKMQRINQKEYYCKYCKIIRLDDR
ncbi:MAG TPA: hypothetical protein VD815_11340 [Candidatus Saccharimonadales bacterium]|nr:hypothetical protein [Candidatus Saccharimonadales bacterium]